MYVGRIGWADAHARKRVGDLHTFETLLLEPLQKDLVKDIWLYERYDAYGTQTRTAFYFEYPALVTMFLTEIRYGVTVRLTSIDIDPFPVTDFSYAFGGVFVSYSKESIQFKTSIAEKSDNMTHTKSFTVHGLYPNSSYTLLENACVSKSQTVISDSDGLITFEEIPVSSTCMFTINLVA
jgi:hypothetical protein